MKIHKGTGWKDNVKCDCGHYPKDHHAGEGWCGKCGCTWYYPNIQYIKKMKKDNKMPDKILEQRKAELNKQLDLQNIKIDEKLREITENAGEIDHLLIEIQEIIKYAERWQKVEDMCKSHMACIEEDGQLIDHLDDDVHYIFEAAMEATFGKGIWPKYNRLNEENEEREYERHRRS
jgi:hypothetical protein